MKNALTSHWSPEEIRKAMAEDPTLKEKWQDLTITLPTETFSGQKSIEFEGTKIDFLRLGGHTPCSSIAVFPDYRFMFAGDLIFAERYPTLLWDGNPIELVSVLKRIDQMEIDTFAPGHGPICGKSSIDNLTDYYECLIENCGKLLADGKSIEEISDLWKELCPIPGVPMDEMRHKRNINSISGFLRGHDAR